MKKNGFTLLELLIVIGILAVLATTAVLVLNPAELIKQSRDSKRLIELKTIDSALNFYLINGGDSFGSSNTVYISLPDTSSICASYSLPTLPSSWSYNCKSNSDYRKIDGNGWIPANFSQLVNPPLVVLPIDPQNDSNYYYAYVPGGSWVITSLLESEKYLKQFALADGGTDSGRFEIGSNLNLWANASGLVGYWNFNENSGSTAYDYSGNNNNGILINSPIWTSGKVGNALSLNGSNNYVNINDSSSLNFGSATDFTIEGWIKRNTTGSQFIFDKRSNSTAGYIFYFDTSNGLALQVNGNNRYTNNTLIDTTSWHHVAISVDRDGYINSYLDGVSLKLLTNFNGNLDTTNQATIGGRSFTQPLYLLNGLIDEFRVYNRILSSSEILAIYSAEK